MAAYCSDRGMIKKSIWVNPYLPDRSREGEDALEEFIKILVGSIAAKLQEVEKSADFAFLLNASEESIRREARLLKKEINDIKECFARLQQGGAVVMMLTVLAVDI